MDNDGKIRAACDYLNMIVQDLNNAEKEKLELFISDMEKIHNEFGPQQTTMNVDGTEDPIDSELLLGNLYLCYGRLLLGYDLKKIENENERQYALGSKFAAKRNIVYFEKAKELIPDSSDLWYRMATVYEIALDYQKAKDCIYKAYELDSDDTNIRIMYNKFNKIGFSGSYKTLFTLSGLGVVVFIIALKSHSLIFSLVGLGFIGLGILYYKKKKMV